MAYLHMAKIRVLALLCWAFVLACSDDHHTVGEASGGSPVGVDGGQSSSSDSAGGNAASDANVHTGGTANGSTDSDGSTHTTAYANVMAVSVSGSDGSYSFSVSVESSDIDCSQYANWWEVLDSNGSLIYRKVLSHSHTDDNGTSDPGAPGNTFTRSSDPNAVNVVADQVIIVRAHMSSVGYQGIAMRGSVAAGFSLAPDIGPDFAAQVATDEPQPTECQF